MKKKLFTLPVLALAIMFSSTLFTANANADHNVKRQQNHSNYSSHARSNRGNKYGHYNKNKHYRKSYKQKRYNHDRYGYKHGNRHYQQRNHHNYKKNDSKFFFSLVLPITHLFNDYERHYDGY